MASPKYASRPTKHLSLEAVKVLFSKRVIAFRPEFAKIGQGTPLGRLGTNAGIFLAQSLYWTEHTTDPDGWFFKTQDEWSDETGLSEEEQATARKILKRHGLIQEDLRGSEFSDKRRSQGKLHYRLNLEAVRAALEQLIDDTPKLAAMEAQRKQEKAEKRREKSAAKKRQTEVTSEHVPGNAGNMQQASNSVFCSPPNEEHVPGNNGDMFPALPDTGLYIKTTNKNTGITSTTNIGKNPSSSNPVDDDVDFSNPPSEPANAGKVLGEINTTDKRQAKRNEQTVKHNPLQNAAQAGQPLLAGAVLSPVTLPSTLAGDSELLRALLGIGFKAPVAAALLSKSPDEVARQLEFWPYQDQDGIPNKPGWFTSAVRGAYDAPPAYIKKQEAKAREAAREAERREQEAREAQDRLKRQTAEKERSELDAEFAALPPAIQQAYDAEIVRRAPGMVAYARTSTDGIANGAIAAERRQLLRSGWEPETAAPRYVSADSPEAVIKAAYDELAPDVLKQVEAEANSMFDQLGMPAAKPGSNTWLTMQRNAFRQMLKKGLLKISAVQAA